MRLQWEAWRSTFPGMQPPCVGCGLGPSLLRPRRIVQPYLLMRMSDAVHRGNAADTQGASAGEGSNLVPSTVDQAIPIQPVAGAAIAAPTAGQVNQIDPWIRENFVQCPLGEFTVSPRNTPGEVLFNLALGPGLNPYLSHLAAMYTGWVGNMEVQLILAGNAFTAGKVVVALIPPYFNMQTLTTSQITCFPHIMCDVRTLEPILLPLLDVRRTLWHPTNSEDDTMRLVCMLYTPLRTNSPGDESFVVSGRLLSRPSLDFNFLYLTPPIAQTPYELPTVPRMIPSEMTHSRWPAPIYQVVADPSLLANPQWQNGRVTIDGQLLGTTPISSTWVCSIAGTADYRYISGSDSFEECKLALSQPNGSPFVVGDAPAPYGYPDFSATISFSFQVETRQNSAYSVREFSLTTSSQTINQSPYTGTVYMDRSETLDYQYQDDRIRGVPHSVHAFRDQLPDYVESGQPPNLAPPIGPFMPGEVLLRFRTYVRQEATAALYQDQPIDCALPQEFVTHLATHGYTLGSDALLLRYRNLRTGQLICEAKLYAEGFLAISYSGTGPLQLPIDGVFEVVSWVQRLYQLAPVGTSTAGRSLAS
uniref:VP1 capsid protein n=2 Tax=Norovirus GV TaxID=1246677 RepID=K4NTQ0_NORV|nr:VP1 capsid protein [Norovirus Rn/GV/HKU_KT/HKG/2012]